MRIIFILCVLVLASCATSKHKQSTSTDLVQVTTKDSTAKKDSSSVQKIEVVEVKDSTQEETVITETETVFDTSGKVIKKTERKTEKKKKTGSQTNSQKASDSTGVKTEIKKSESDSTVYRHQETIKEKKSFSMLPWFLWLIPLLYFLIRWLYKRYKNRSLFLLLPFLFMSCKKDIQEPEKKFKPASKTWFAHIQNIGVYQGIRSTFEVKNMGGGQQTKAVWTSAHVHTPSGWYWIQTGYHQWGDPSYFVMAFTNGGPYVPSISLRQAPTVSAGEVHTWYIKIVNGDVIVGIDSTDYLKYPIGADYVENPDAVIEGEGTTTKPGAIPIIRFYPALEVYNGTWTPAPSAYSWGSGYGVQLNGVNDVSMGSPIKTKPGGVLW
jgi:hypothetical protein